MLERGAQKIYAGTRGLQRGEGGSVASSILDGIENGTEDIFPDAMSEALYAQWLNDHKAVERQLAVL